MRQRLRRFEQRFRKRFRILSKKFRRLFIRASVPSITFGNKVVPVRSGTTAFNVLCDLIDESNHFIKLEYYIFRNDAHGRIIADMLIEKAKNGVDVFLLYDFIGCFDIDNDFFEHLKANGIKVTVFNPIKLFSNPFQWDRRDHRKIAIFDGVKAIVSGWNIGSEYLDADNESSMGDMGVQIDGPAVKAIEKSFDRLWERWSKRRLSHRPSTSVPRAGNDEVWVVESSPRTKRKHIYRMYLLAMVAARQTIWIENAYFVPTRKIVRRLINAVHRGVDVRIVLPGRIDVPVIKYASHYFFKRLLGSGVKLYEMDNLTLHSKVACVDGAWTTIGSTNLHRHSLEKNYELNIVVVSDDFGCAIRDEIAGDMCGSRCVDTEEWSKRGVVNKIRELLSRLVAPFL